MIRSTELARQLSAEGFTLAYDDHDAMEFVLVRSADNDLFERIRVTHGNLGATATVGVETSIVPGRTALKGLCIHRCLIEVATDPKTGWSVLRDEHAAQTLAERIRSVAPNACRDLRKDVGKKLLESTKSARIRAERYFAMLKRVGAVQVREEVSANAQAEITRILQQQIVCIPKGKRYYEMALQVIARYCAEVECDEDWLRGRDADSASDRDLMIMLQIIASRLAHEPGWSTMPLRTVLPHFDVDL